MEEIEKLLAELGENVPSKINNKIKSLERLNVKLASAKTEHDSDPTDESQEQLNNITEYVDEVRDEIIEALEIAIEKKQAVKPVVEAPVVAVTVIETPIVEPTQTQQTQKPIGEEPVEEKSGGFGWLGLVAGVVLLIGTAGVINTLKK